MQIVRSIIIVSFFSYSLCSQIDVRLLHDLNLLIPEHELQTDSNALRILQIPLLGFDLDIYSNPDIRSFLSRNNNSIIINITDYNNNIDDVSSHILDVKNHLLYYGVKSENAFYSFGLDHQLWMETSLSKELISLIINGNYQYLNDIITLNDNGARLYNYFSLFFGYSKKINNTIIGGKLKFIKGITSFGINGRETSIHSADNYYTENTPFTTQVNTDFDAFRHSKSSIFSNLGIAVDASLKHSFSDKISVFSSVSELGFIYWKEDQYFSKGTYNFDGVDYTLDEDLIDEFDTLYDTIIDVFDIQEKINEYNIRSLSYEIDFGVSYIFNDLKKNQLMINYNLKKLDFEFSFFTYRNNFLYNLL